MLLPRSQYVVSHNSSADRPASHLSESGDGHFCLENLGDPKTLVTAKNTTLHHNLKCHNPHFHHSEKLGMSYD